MERKTELVTTIAMVTKKNGRYVQQKIWEPMEFLKEFHKRDVKFITSNPKFNKLKFIMSKNYREQVLDKMFENFKDAMNLNDKIKMTALVLKYKEPIKGGKK